MHMSCTLCCELLVVQCHDIEVVNLWDGDQIAWDDNFYSNALRLATTRQRRSPYLG